MTLSLSGIRVLLVEDEPIIAMTAEDMLGDLGCTIAYVAVTLSEALAAAREGDFVVAILDINLNGVDSMPVATLLRRRKIPFIFTTGYGSSGRAAEHADAPLITKPYRLMDLEQGLLRALQAGQD
jgi:CheY-like chemotaxis protein